MTSLAPLPWQLESWSTVGRRVEEDRLPHALLFAGPAGIGKAHFARALAARLLCEAAVSGTGCGNCKSCQLLASGSHPDFLDVAPEEGSRVIKIDQVRELIEFAGKTAAISRVKCIVLGPAESMNINAANALLKCLEEPSGSTQLLLYSHQPSGLPPTVRSRCQTMAFAVPSADACLEWLQYSCVETSLARELLNAADGRPLAALALFNEDSLGQRQAVRKGLDALLEGKLSPLEFPGLVSDLELEEVLALMQVAVESRLREIARPASRPAREVFYLRDDLARLQRAISGGANPNRQLIIEDCSTRLARALRHSFS